MRTVKWMMAIACVAISAMGPSAAWAQDTTPTPATAIHTISDWEGKAPKLERLGSKAHVAAIAAAEASHLATTRSNELSDRPHATEAHAAAAELHTDAAGVGAAHIFFGRTLGLDRGCLRQGILRNRWRRPMKRDRRSAGARSADRPALERIISPHERHLAGVRKSALAPIGDILQPRAVPTGVGDDRDEHVGAWCQHTVVQKIHSPAQFSALGRELDRQLLEDWRSDVGLKSST